MSRSRIAEVLKQGRKTKRYSVEDVSKLLLVKYAIKISGKTLYSYETGHRQPDADLLMALCEIYGIDDIMEAFREPEPETTKTPAPEEPEAGDKVSIEELTDFLERAGYIQKGGDLSDADFQFLAHLIGLIDLWCQNRQGGK